MPQCTPPLRKTHTGASARTCAGLGACGDGVAGDSARDCGVPCCCNCCGCCTAELIDARPSEGDALPAATAAANSGPADAARNEAPGPSNAGAERAEVTGRSYAELIDVRESPENTASAGFAARSARETPEPPLPPDGKWCR